jgi:hypothetical protein
LHHSDRTLENDYNSCGNPHFSAGKIKDSRQS